MAYAGLGDVQALISKFELTSTTRPNLMEATVITDQISAEMDGAISGAGYTVPVTSPEWFLEALKLLNSYGAAATILRSMFPDATGPDETPAYAYFAARYKEGLQGLITGAGIPSDVPTNSATVMPSTYFTRNPDTEETLGDIAEPWFKRSSVF